MWGFNVAAATILNLLLSVTTRFLIFQVLLIILPYEDDSLTEKKLYEIF